MIVYVSYLIRLSFSNTDSICIETCKMLHPSNMLEPLRRVLSFMEVVSVATVQS